MNEIAIWLQMNRIGWNWQDKIVLEILIDTQFINFRWELAISFLTFVIDISHSSSAITIPSLKWDYTCKFVHTVNYH